MKKYGYAVTGLLAVLALAGCNRQDQGGLEPIPENPASQPAATPAAPPPAPAVATADHLSRNLSTDKYNTQVGTLVEGVLVNDGSKEGYLLFGPYMPLKAGRYTVELQGNLDALPHGHVRMDVSSGKGTVVHGGINVTETGKLPPFEVNLPSDVTDVEVRVLMPKDAKASVSSYQISKKLP